jgi:hypothetical protein
MLRRKHLLAVGALSVLLCSALVVLVEADAAMWSKTYGGTGFEAAYSMVATSDGGYAIAGVTGAKVWLVKTDGFGNMQWNQTYGGETSWDLAYSLVETGDGGYAIAGSSEDNSTVDAWVVKTDEFGNMEWNRTYAGQGGRLGTSGQRLGYDWFSSVVEAQDGGYVFAGTTEAELDDYVIDHGYMDAWLVKTDEYGNVKWNRTYGGPWDDSASALVAASDGGCVWAGYYTFSNFTAEDPNYWLVEHGWLVKTDAYGNAQWNTTYGETGDYHVQALVVAPDGGYALAGDAVIYSGSSGFPVLEVYCRLVKTDAVGNMQWNKTYGDLHASSLVATADGGYALAGTATSAGSGHFWLVKTDAFGNAQWNTTYAYMVNSTDVVTSLVAAPDGGYALAGYTVPPNVLEAEFWLVKTNEFGVVPEFPEWLLLSSVTVLTLTASVLSRRRKRACDFRAVSEFSFSFFQNR